MAEAAKTKRPRFTTPTGIAIYPRLTRPDTKFNADGVYQVKLAVDGALAQGMVDQIDEMMKVALTEAKATEAAKDKAKRKTPKQCDPPYTVDDETGVVTFSFKRKASGINKKTEETWKAKVAIFDAKGKPMADPNVGGGTKMKVSYSPTTFYIAGPVGAGVKLNLEAVQIIDLVEYSGGGDSSSYGFGEEEGFNGSEAAPIPESEEGATAEESKDF